MKVSSLLRKKLVAVSGGAAVVALAAGGIAYAAAPSGAAPAVRPPGGVAVSAASAVGACRPAAPVPAAGRAKTASSAITDETATSSVNKGIEGRCRRLDRLIRLARHTVHAELIVHARGGYRTIEIDRGKLVSDSSGTITIVRPDGPTVRAALTQSTRYVGSTEAELKPGEGVILVQASGDALVVRARGSKSGP